MTPVPHDAAAAMVRLDGGRFWMGSDDHYPEEAPCREVEIDPFSIDARPVTNRQFRAFVKATGHKTVAERRPDPRDYPDAHPRLLRAGSSVFIGTAGPVPLDDPQRWWAFVPGASWKHPEGPRSDTVGREEHPVVHVAFADVQAYADWARKRLPTEAEWEFAARAGRARLPYAWGTELAPGGARLANYWTGAFPWRRDTPGRWLTSAVGDFAANAFGLFDMIGNVWEWTADWYAARASPAPACCVPRNPRGGTEEASHAGDSGGPGFGRKVLKGGSHLCAEAYCRRYRPAARHPQSIDTGTSHIGFRCAISL